MDKKEIKMDQNTLPDDIDILRNPNTETIIFRYVLAASFCKGKSVLDCASGYGHGAGILHSLGAKKVTAFDMDDNALNYISEHWKNTNIINRYKKDLTVPDINEEHNPLYDIVVSIETFEHLPKDKIPVYLKNLQRWCKPGGRIFITTPRRKLHEWKYDGGTHQYEYTPEEFLTAITGAFPTALVQTLGIQEIRMGEYNQLVSVLNPDITRSDIMCVIISLKK